MRIRIKRHITRWRIGCLVFITAVILLCGCGYRESSKTIILPKETEDNGDKSGIDIKNIKEYTYEGNILTASWKEGEPGEICVLGEQGDQQAYQTIDVYQNTVTESIVLDEQQLGMVEISPGGQYITYEVIDDSAVQLILYRTETGEKQVLRKWADMSEVYIYEWSSDGTKFFGWPNSSNYEQDLPGGWRIYRYDMESNEKTEIQMEGDEGMWRTVLPNKDGSKVYVTETCAGSNSEAVMAEEEEIKEKYGIATEDYSEYNVSGEGYDQSVTSRNWVVDMETAEVRELDQEKAGLSNPFRYTEQGVFGKEGNEVWLVSEPSGQAEKKRILASDCEEVCVCEDGDHIFLVDWETGEGNYLQITGIRIQDGEIIGRQILYKNIYDIYDRMIVGRDDSELIIQTEEYLSKGDCLIRMTVLEY